MKIVPVADLKARLSHYLEECEDSPVIVTRNGRPVAALITISDNEDLERLIIAHTPRLRRLLDEAAERVRQGGGIAHEEFWGSE